MNIADKKLRSYIPLQEDDQNNLRKYATEKLIQIKSQTKSFKEAIITHQGAFLLSISKYIHLLHHQYTNHNPRKPNQMNQKRTKPKMPTQHPRKQTELLP